MKYVLIIMVVLLAFGVLVSSSHAEIDPETAVGVWLFEEGKGNEAEDSSGKDHNGMIQGATKWNEGKFGEAMEFAGNSVNVPDHDDFNFGEEKNFTVVFWFNFGTSQDWNRLVRERDPAPWGSGSAGWEMQTNQVAIHVTLDDVKGNNVNLNYPEVGNGEWYHLAMIVNRDKKLMTTYLNAENEKTIDIAAIESVTNELPIVFGGGFAGLIDEIAIFNVALEQDDIEDIAEEGLLEAIFGGKAVSPLTKLTSAWGSLKK